MMVFIDYPAINADSLRMTCMMIHKGAESVAQRAIVAIAVFLILGIFQSVVVAADQTKAAYDPLVKISRNEIQSLVLLVTDKKRDREIPLKIFMTQQEQPAPVLLFSHGLGGSRHNNAYLAEHWAARGYIVVYLQHPGSDVSVWEDVPPLRRRAALRRAASSENAVRRYQDVSAALDQLEQWHQAKDHPLTGKLNMQRVGMSGHSFGANTTQGVSGQQFPGNRPSFRDERIDAAVAFSPNSPRLGDPKQAFGKINIPMMLMTGTLDHAVIGDRDVTSRLKVYPALPAGGKYELVLHKAEHSAFTDRSLPGDKQKRNPNHHRAILGLTTAFWDAYLNEDQAAKAWLDGEGAKSILEKEDRWQRK